MTGCCQLSISLVQLTRPFCTQALVTAAYAAVAATAFAFVWNQHYNLAAALLVNWARDRLSLPKVAALLALAWFGKVCVQWLGILVHQSAGRSCFHLRGVDELCWHVLLGLVCVLEVTHMHITYMRASIHILPLTPNTKTRLHLVGVHTHFHNHTPTHSAGVDLLCALSRQPRGQPACTPCT